MNIFLKISQQTFWQIIGKAVSIVSTIIILGLVTRKYGEEGTGLFTLALTYISMFMLLGDFGFNAHVLKSLQPSVFSLQKQIFRKLLGTRIVWAIVLMGISTSLLPLLPIGGELFRQLVTFGSPIIFGSAIFVSTNLIFQSRLRYDLSVSASSAGVLINLFLVTLFVYLKLPIFYLIISQLINWILVVCLALYFSRKLTASITPIWDWVFSRKLISSAWPIAATLALNVVYFRADAFLVAFYKGVADAGIYNVAYSVFQSALVLPAFIMNAYYPMMLKSLKDIRFMGLGLFLLAGLGTVLTLILAPLVTHLLTGGGFLGSAQSLQILSLGFPSYFLSALLMWILISQGRYKTLLIIYAFGLIINLVLNFMFIPRYSFYAASTITVISEYLILAMQIIVLKFAVRGEKSDETDHLH